MENIFTTKNAGLVILNNYIPMYLERLGFIENKQFSNSEMQHKAVVFVHYLATGITSDHPDPLSNILCSLPLNEPVLSPVAISEAEVDLTNGLINAVINYWPAIGQSSISGFRGNWIIRDGILTETPDRWELTVDRRAYDLLINKSPFSFSIIKYPWMAKPLYVIWNY